MCLFFKELLLLSQRPLLFLLFSFSSCRHNTITEKLKQLRILAHYNNVYTSLYQLALMKSYYNTFMGVSYSHGSLVKLISVKFGMILNGIFNWSHMKNTHHLHDKKFISGLQSLSITRTFLCTKGSSFA